MAALFQLPKVTGLPGARLYFFRTNTATPQDVFTDEDCTVAHTQPVEADGAGVFPPIYLAQTDYNYRVSYYTSADVLIYTVDDVPNKLGDGRNLTIASESPYLELIDTSTFDPNRNRVKFFQQGGDFTFAALNDAGTIEANIFKVFRTGVTVDDMRIYAAALTDANGVEFVTYSSGSFIGTLTGCTTSPLGEIWYQKTGSVVTLRIPTAGEGLSGTSNSTAMTITGMPAAIRPTRTQYVMNISVGDNSLLIGDGESVGIKIGTDGVMTFMINGSETGFTNSGVKNVGPGCTITYLLN